MESNKYLQTIESSKVTTDDAAVKAAVNELLEKYCAENATNEVYRFLLNCIDLTTLSTDDSERSVAAFTQRVNDFENNYPGYKNVAAICVYSKFAEVVRENLDVSEVNVAVCSANFPSSQARLEVKTVETALAVADGADEVDIVFPVNYFVDGAYEEVADEIAEIKQSAKAGDREAHLKVILETGLLKSAANIRAASILSMYSGADFIKTSTGKIYEGATVEAAYVMCQCIKEYYEKCGRMVGFKASGGIRTSADAVKYYTIVKEVLGEKWLTNEYFRIGASSLANNLFADITGEAVKPF
ncbi:MAG: deoxyribose-phosphate aldolase [Muribaculaceae bacterium]